MNRIRILRKRAGLTQKQLAEKARIDRGLLSSIENNKGNPTQKTLKKIAKALECDISDLIQ